MPNPTERTSSVKVRLAWYDMWIGAFWDRYTRTLYVCPLPCLLVEIHIGGDDDFDA